MTGAQVAGTNRRKGLVRRLGAGGLILIFLVATGPCTITHRFGPYHGRVIEETTAEPIEGALVLMVFFTEMYTLGGFTTHFVEALETSTDARGEFRIPAFRAWAFRVPHKWNDISPVTIFKAGYAIYDMRFIPQDEHVTIRLPKLSTREERLDSLILPSGIPDEKLKNLMERFRQERRNLGILK